MSITDYLIYSLMGMAVVFFALVLLLVMVKLLTKAVPAEEEADPMKVLTTVDPEPASEVRAPELAKGNAGELKLYDTEPEIAAMLMAIVADELETPINELRFKSIKEIKPQEDF